MKKFGKGMEGWLYREEGETERGNEPVAGNSTLASVQRMVPVSRATNDAATARPRRHEVIRSRRIPKLFDW